MVEWDEIDTLDQQEPPAAPPPAPAQALAPPPVTSGTQPSGGGAPSAPGPTPRPPRAKGRHRGLYVVIVIIVVIAVAAGAYVSLVKPSSSTTSSIPIPPSVCLGDKIGDWPTYLGEATRNAQNCAASDLSSANAADIQLQPLWTFNTSYGDPGVLQAEPIVANNTVYIGAGNGIFYAINATTGLKVWQSANLGNNTYCLYPDGLTSSATVSGGLVYLGGADGYFYALNEANGSIAWDYYIGNQSQGYYDWSSPLVLPSLGYIYYGVASNCDHPLVNGGLLQLSIATHQLVKFFSDLSPLQIAACNNTKQPFNETYTSGCGGSIWGSPSYDAATNTIWAATGNGYALDVPEYGDSLMEWNATTLSLISHWTIPEADQIMDGDFGTTPTLINPVNGPPMVFVTDKNNWSYAFYRSNFSNGPAWQYKISIGPSVAPDAYGGGLIYIAGHGTSIGGTQYPGGIRAFNPMVNQTIWQLGMPGEVYGAPIYANGLVVVAGGYLLDVLNSTTGKVLWSYEAPGEFLAAPSIANGIIYIGNADGDVLAFGLPPGGGASSTPATVLPFGYLSESPDGVLVFHLAGPSLHPLSDRLVAAVVRRP